MQGCPDQQLRSPQLLRSRCKATCSPSHARCGLQVKLSKHLDQQQALEGLHHAPRARFDALQSRSSPSHSNFVSEGQSLQANDELRRRTAAGACACLSDARSRLGTRAECRSRGKALCRWRLPRATQSGRPFPALTAPQTAAAGMLRTLRRAARQLTA